METYRVLVVDDEPGMRAGVARALRDATITVPETGEDLRFETLTAEDGEAALELLAAEHVDLMLLDYKLPGINGLDVLERLDRDGDETGVLTIMITAYASLETAVTATKRGAYDFLAKPFTPAELKAAVRKAARHLAVRRQARRLAAEKRQLRFQFISVLSHELKAPLNAIDGYLKIIRDRAAGDDVAAYEKMLDRSMIRLDGMRKLIFDLLDLTRIESGQKRRDFADVDLREVAESAIETLAPAADDADVTIELEAPEALPLRADRGEMEIILNNLVSNGVKYNRPGGTVTVALADEGERARITVTDTGIGMTDEEAARLFEDFVRIRNEKTRNILGSGLGLSTVRKLARMYAGDIAVRSEPDVGSTFTVTLHKHTEPEADENAQQAGHPELAARE